MFKADVNQPTLVILRSLGLGDFITALPALRALRRAFPQHLIFLTCPHWLKQLGHYCHVADQFIEGGIVSRGHGMSESWVPDDPRAYRDLEAAQLHGLVDAPTRPDIAVNLRGKDARDQQILLSLCPRRLISFRNVDIPRTATFPVWKSGEHEVVRWCRLLNEHGIPADINDIHITPPDCSLAERVRGATLIHPGAGTIYRQWPVDRWASIARWEKNRGRNVLITGSTADVELAKELADLAGLNNDSILAGKTDILQLISVVSKATKVISVDTGIAHVAVAVGTPSIVLYGRSLPSRWGPPPTLFKHRILWKGITGDPYSETPDSGLLLIKVEELIAEILACESTIWNEA